MVTLSAAEYNVYSKVTGTIYNVKILLVKFPNNFRNIQFAISVYNIVHVHSKTKVLTKTFVFEIKIIVN